MIRMDTIEDLVRVLDDHPEWLEAVRARLLSRELLELPSRFSNFVEKTERFVEEMNRFVAATNRQFQSIRDDLGVLKGAHARNAAERNVGLIARSMGLRQRRVLDGGELFDLARAAGADVRDDAIESYVQADLVFEAENEQGAVEYVAVEVSYTANGRDTARAMRNAGFLTRFTGSACRPVVASLRIDERIAELVESGRVAWHRLPRKVLESA